MCHISPKVSVPAITAKSGFHIEARAGRRHTKLPKNLKLPRSLNPDARGLLLDKDACATMESNFHTSSNCNYKFIHSSGLVLSPFAHGLRSERGRVGVRFVCAGATPPGMAP